MDVYQPPQRRKSRARERYEARQSRHVVTPFTQGGDDYDAVVPTPSAASQRARRTRRPSFPMGSSGTWQERLRLLVQDAAWYALHRPWVLQGGAAVIAILFLLFVATHVLAGRLFPNVWTMGVHIGEMTVDEAAASLQVAWENSIKIQLVDEGRQWEASPADLGLQLDARATVEAARGVGMSGIPFGYSVVPVVTLDLFKAQDYLLNLTETVNYAPTNAGFRWQGETLVGVAGQDGRVLDVGVTVENLRTDPAVVADQRRLELVMHSLAPQITDPEPYLEEARRLVANPFELAGYDPFRNEYVAWSTDQATITSWLEVNEDGLGLRESAYAPFLEAQNASLVAADALRYLEPTETMRKVEEAILSGDSSAELRIRYREATYAIEPGDTGYKIARKTGMPFYAITTANPGVNWDALSIGQEITLPTRDTTLPIDPVADKRIIVDLDNQYLVAFENDQIVFSWLISSGQSQFPTYPGIYQILSHEESAFGSSFELCTSSANCGQWEMAWFMGIYEVVPGLMNGFHGAVTLPNGTVLMGAHNVGAPYTYGCVMSENGNAEALYHWADQGTIVEIISSDYPPMSDLARLARERAETIVRQGIL